MTAGESPEREHHATSRAVRVNRFARIFRARRNESTGPAKKWREQQLIEPNDDKCETGAWCHGFDWTRKRLSVD